MRKTIAELASNTINKYCSKFSGNSILTFLRCMIRVTGKQFLRRDKVYVFRKDGFFVRIALSYFLFSFVQRDINTYNSIPQIGKSALLGQNVLFPIPLINIDGVNRCVILIRPQSVHIGQDAFIYLNL